MSAAISSTARLIAVSGLGPKEPAAFIVEANGRRLLLDCGEGSEAGRLPDFEAIGRVDAIVLSHGHKDHAGALRLRDRIGMPPVFATAPVLARLKDMPGHEIPICGTADVLGTAITTGRDGHAPGGVWLRLEAGDGLLYMADCSLESPVYVFDEPPPTATAIIDASYGEAEEALDRQRKSVADVVAAGPVLLPVPADGRAPEIAMCLIEAGFEVSIDQEVRSVVAMLAGSARASAKPEVIARLDRLRMGTRALDETAEPRGAMVAHGASGDVGTAAKLIRRWQGEREPAILFTGHVGADSTGKQLLDSARARFQRWNVHPRFSDNLRLVESLASKRIVPAFGEPQHLSAWRARLAPREVVTSTPIAL
ncbi:MAG TPA: MBL fold metallo-hydrolase [Bryobacteraceae bacterium]